MIAFSFLLQSSILCETFPLPYRVVLITETKKMKYNNVKKEMNRITKSKAYIRDIQ